MLKKSFLGFLKVIQPFKNEINTLNSIEYKVAMSVSFGESRIERCCDFHEGKDVHYSIPDTPNSNINALKQLMSEGEIILYIKDEKWIGNYFRRYSVLGWDSQYEMIWLECGSYIDPVGLLWVSRKFDTPLHSINLLGNNNDEERESRRCYREPCEYEDGVGALW